VINGLLQLLVFQVLGELISKLLLPSIPGPVIGLVVLLGSLIALGSTPPRLEQVAQAIVQNLGLLFIPASAGVIMFLPMLKENLGAIIAALLISVSASIAVTGLVLKWFAGDRAEDEHAT
jgi:putative effector of murein hydrolase LrgA (UPF0299 family)